MVGGNAMKSIVFAILIAAWMIERAILEHANKNPPKPTDSSMGIFLVLIISFILSLLK